MRWVLHVFGEPHLKYKLDNLFLVATWVLYVLGAAIINGIFITGHFINRWKDSIKRTAQLEKEKTMVQFDNLKNQINPHFLFNALSALDSLISENPRLASQFLQHLSRVYRYVLQNKDRTAVPLEVELDFIKNYIFLVETRFQKSMRIKMDVPNEHCDKMIVPVTLQVLIENAIKHNVANEQKPLRINVSIANDYLIVENDFQPRSNVETSNGQGLENLKSLYRFLSDNPLKVEQGQKFKVSVPLLDVNANGIKE
jgi:LytS/YehU family sensor histidine kinase